jgi:hypothetical protein
MRDAQVATVPSGRLVVTWIALTRYFVIIVACQWVTSVILELGVTKQESMENAWRRRLLGI